MASKRPLKRGVPLPSGKKKNTIPTISTEERKNEINNNRIINELPEGIPYSMSLRVFSYEDMKKISSVRIENYSLEGSGSINDPLLGGQRDFSTCMKCYSTNCEGHFGLIDFESFSTIFDKDKMMIINPLYANYVYYILNCICVDCKRIVAPKDKYYEILMSLGKLTFEKRLKKLSDICSTLACTRKNCTEKRKLLVSVKDFEIGYFLGGKQVIKRGLKETGFIYFESTDLNKKNNFFYPYEIYEIFNEIPDEDLILLGFRKYKKEGKELFMTHPKDYIMRAILVPPPNMRPYMLGDKKLSNSLTMVFISIIKALKSSEFEDLRGYLCNIYNKFYSLLYGPPTTKGNRLIREYLKRLIQGKNTIIKSEGTSGKVTKMVFRGVASLAGLTDIEMGWATLPESSRDKLAESILVNSNNFDAIKELYEKEEILYVKPIDGENLIDLTKRGDYKIKIGDTIYRRGQDGDSVIINRNPTLGKGSIMKMDAKFLKHVNVVGIQSPCTTPYNLDFDGDELNVHKLGPIATVEARNSMNIIACARNRGLGKLRIGLVLNSLLGPYLMTDPNMDIDEDLFDIFTDKSLITYREDLINFEERLYAHNMKKNSGNALISTLFPKDFNYKGRNNKSEEVLIVDGILVKGRLDSSLMKTTQGGILDSIQLKYGNERYFKFIDNFSKVMTFWLQEFYGFSFGINDCIPGKEFKKHLKALYSEAEKKIQQIEYDDSLTGNQKYEAKADILSKLNNLMLIRSKQLMTEQETNPLVQMSEKSGAKGNIMTYSQINASIGQQFVGGSPLMKRSGERLFYSSSLRPTSLKDLGYGTSSLEEGLEPEECFETVFSSVEPRLSTLSNVPRVGVLEDQLNNLFRYNVIGILGNVVSDLNGSFINLIYGTGLDPEYTVKFKDKDGFDESGPFDAGKLMDDIMLNVGGWIDSSIAKTYKSEIQETLEKNQGAPLNYLKDIIEERKIQIEEKPKIFENILTINEKISILKLRVKRLMYGDQIRLNKSFIKDVTDIVTIATDEYKAGLLDDYYVVRYGKEKEEIKIYATKENVKEFI